MFLTIPHLKPANLEKLAPILLNTLSMLNTVTISKMTTGNNN